MEDFWRRYPSIKKIFGDEWLNDPINQMNHPLFRVCNEVDYLSSLNKYLDYLGGIARAKPTLTQLKNKTQFFDIYYEFEIAYFLSKFGLKPKLHNKISGKQTDIFLEKENIVIEITHLHIPYIVEKKVVDFDSKVKSQPAPKGVTITFKNMEKMKSYLEEKEFQDVYPNIVCFCPEISAGNCYDLENLIEDYKVSKNVSLLAIWRHQRILCSYQNPNGKKIEWKSSKLKNFFNSSFSLI